MRSNRKHARGFTLLELMIVVIVIGVLASIAFGSYQTHVIKSRRSAAEACLLEEAQYMERLYTTKLSYASQNNVAVPVAQCQTDLGVFYTFDKPTAAARTYTLTATPKGQQATKDTKCATVGVNQAGTKTITGSGTVSDCW